MLFNNPYAKKALKDMDCAQRARYKKLGEEMYGTIDFEDRKNLNNLPPCTEDLRDYLDTVLRSGFHPRYLNTKEIEILFGHCGDKWYEKYGYTMDDIPQLKGTKFDPNVKSENQVEKYIKDKLDNEMDGVPKNIQDKLKEEFKKQFNKKK